MDNSGLKSTSEKVYQVLITVILSICAALAILPFLLLLSSSLTDESTLIRDGYAFIPKKFSLYAYEYLFSASAARIFKSYGITILVTVVGTGISLLIGPMLAWVLSRRDYKRAKVLTFLVFFTTLFNGGIVPSYIMWSQLWHVKDTIWGLIFPSLIMNGFYVILYKNNFASNIHPSLVEAAKIDGAGELRIYFKIVLRRPDGRAGLLERLDQRSVLHQQHQPLLPAAVLKEHHRQHLRAVQHGEHRLGGRGCGEDAGHLHPHVHGGHRRHPHHGGLPLLPEGVRGRHLSGRRQNWQGR